MDPARKPSYIAIARIVRTRGNRGEVLADPHTDFPARFESLEEVWLEFDSGVRERFSLQDCWEHKGRQVMKFAGVDSISSAERLVHAWVEVESARAVSLPAGTYFDHDLVGCRVVDSCAMELGTVKGVLRIAGNSQLVVQGKSGEFLMPAAAAVCREVSIEEKRIRVELPPGLMDLNK